VLLLTVASPVLLMAQQVAGTQCWINGKLVGGFPPGYNCPGTGGGSSSGGNYAAGNAQLQQAVQQATTNFLNWLFNAGANAQAAAAQRQQMMAELQRRQAEAARLHREEEARRLAEMYNRLSATLKLNGLPNLQLKNSGISAGGLQMKLGDNTQGYGIPGLPGIYTGGPGQGSGMTPVTESKLQLKMGDDAGGAAHVGNPNLPGLALNDGQQSYGIPGLPGIYTGGPGSGSGMTPAAGPGLQMKVGDGDATPPAATGEAFDPRTVDVNNMTPKQAADMAEYISKLPPEEQQRLIAAAQNGGVPPQSAPMLPTAGSAPGAAAQVSGGAAPGTSPAITPQTAAQPVAALQQQVDASQAAAAATVPEDASAKARVGFDTGLGAVATPPAIATTSGQPAFTSTTPQVAARAETINPGATISGATPTETVNPRATIPQATPSAEMKVIPPTAHNARSESANVVASDAGGHSCSQVAELQSQYESLTQQLNVDRQIIHSFGFDKTAEQIDYWGQLPERQMEEAKIEFREMLLDATLVSASQAVGAVGSLTPDEVDALNQLADAQGAPALGIVAGAGDVHRALEFLEESKHAYEAAGAARRGNMFAAAIKLGGLASGNPAFRLLLTADEWAVYQVYQSAAAVQKVHDLTKTSEEDLTLLKSRSERVKNEVDQLASVKRQLAALGSKCDSTSFVKVGGSN